MQHGPKRLPRPEPPTGPNGLQGEVKEVARSGPSGSEFRRHHTSPWGAAACLPDRIHRGLACMAAVFGRKVVSRDIRGPECGDNLIALLREVNQVGREGTQDSALAKCPSNN